MPISLRSLAMGSFAIDDFSHSLANACLHLLGDQIYNGEMERLIPLGSSILAFFSAAEAFDGLDWLSISQG